jgi:hypothetical protein
LLRVTVTVRGAGRSEVTFAVGELDPGFGNHPALLALTQNGRPIGHGPELIVPGDRVPIRFVPGVSRVTVGIATVPATDTDPAAGSPVDVIDGHHEVTLSAALLARLPAETLTVSLKAQVARRPTPRSAVAARGAGGGRPSADSGHLGGGVTDGDVKGGRYVSGVVDLYVGRGPAR